MSSELRKAMVLESSLDCVITLDANRTIVDYNPASERTFGYSQSEAIGRDIAVLLLPPAYREAHQEGLKQASITGLGSILGRRIEIPALRADGREIDIELSVVRGEVSGQRMYTAYLRDITEAKRVDARLHLLESVSVNARDPVLIVGSSTSETQPVVLYVNEAFTQLTGYTKTESVGQPLCFVGSEPANQTNTPLVSALTSTEPVTVELQLLHKHGSPTWVELRATPVHNDDGSIAHHIGLMRDVSQQKQTTAAMRRARDLAEAANRTKSQFLANMSHEFRTPLNAVIGFSQILARGMFGSLNEHQSRSVNNILVSGQHLLQLINEILNLSEMDSGRIILDR
ncbi:MAG: PAS domain-containing sensor histidine kinase, partial [Nannocystaceae bacterium]